MLKEDESLLQGSSPRGDLHARLAPSPTDPLAPSMAGRAIFLALQSKVAAVLMKMNRAIPS